MGSSASVFRMSMSRVPWTRSPGLSAIDAFPLRAKRKNTPLLLVVKRRSRDKTFAPKAGIRLGDTRIYDARMERYTRLQGS
jgi:hypothetical protein